LLHNGGNEMATYLVTGGCGFIGSHLCAALVRRGDAVRVLDHLATGSLSSLPPNAALIRGDVADPQRVRDALAGADGCFHLAAIASVEQSHRDWLGTHRTNLAGALTVFDAAVAAGPIPVVYASSAAVYGDCPSLPLAERSEARPLSAYAVDKIACELHARVASKIHQLPSIGLRLFNVYGPGQSPKSPYSGVISIFCERLRHGEPIEIFGNGRQTRDFVFVSDVVAALVRAMDAELPGHAVFNVCTGHSTSVLELAETIANLCGRSVEIRFRPARDGEVTDSRGDPAAARQALGFSATTDLGTGLAATLAWLEDASAASAAIGKEDG
jgi:UDP-glucose 4-epimerase